MDRMLPDDKTILEEVNHAVLIRSSRASVYVVLTTSEGWNAWFTTDGSFDFQPAGRIVFQWKNWGADRASMGDYGTVLAMDPNRRLSFAWHPDRPDYTTRVDFILEDEPEGCVLRVRESGFADSPEGLHALMQCAAGWGEALTLLKMYIEHGIRY